VKFVSIPSPSTYHWCIRLIRYSHTILCASSPSSLFLYIHIPNILLKCFEWPFTPVQYLILSWNLHNSWGISAVSTCNDITGYLNILMVCNILPFSWVCVISIHVLFMLLSTIINVRSYPCIILYFQWLLVPHFSPDKQLKMLIL